MGHFKVLWFKMIDRPAVKRRSAAIDGSESHCAGILANATVVSLPPPHENLKLRIGSAHLLALSTASMLRR